MEKHLALINGDHVYDLTVLPGTTSADIRRQIGLPREFLISRRDGLPFGDSEDIYGPSREGEKLFASPPAVVGRGIA